MTTAAQDVRIDAILDYWFGGMTASDPLSAVSEENIRWFGGDASTDQAIREQFENDVVLARAGEYHEWAASPDSCVALVILLDQFPRSIYRDTPDAFASDAQALSVASLAVDAGLDERLLLIQCVFLYMPFMHAEALDIQERSCRLFRHLADLAATKEPAHAEYLAGTLEYAIRHRDIVARFQRFPHRNDILGRESTAGEQQFLTQPGSSF